MIKRERREEVIYPKLKEKMKEYGQKTEDVAVWLKISPQAVYDRTCGRTPFRPLEKQMLSVFFKTPEDELFMEVRDAE